jgi:membrane-bound serine protease (ClpP class)
MAESSRLRFVAGTVAVLVLGASAALAGAGFITGQGRDRSASSGDVVFRIPVNGTIEMGVAPFIERSLRDAHASGARAAVLVIETPGGRIDAAERIVDAIKNSEVPVYAFVDRRAFSAGALIALAANEIFMVPGAVMGAATPVTGAGEKAPEKIVSAMRSEMRALAQDRGLDPNVAEAMVDESIAIPGVVEEGRLLTLTTEEAVRLGYARTAASFDEVLAAIDARSASAHDMEVNWAESLVRFFTHPLVAPMLLSIGFLGLIIEIKTPAFGLAGLAGLGSLGLFFGSHYLIGLAGMEELLLLGGGLLLLGLEIFVIPGFGIAGIAGIAALGTGVVLSLVGSFATGADFAQAFSILSLAGVVVAVAIWGLIRHLPGSGRFARSGLMLKEETSRESGYLSAAVRTELIGAKGVALTDLRPSGAARFGEERVDVTAETDFIPAGARVRVVRSEGYRQVVQADDSPEV